MATFGTLGNTGEVPSQLDVATRVDVQDALLNSIAESVSSVLQQRTDRQEAILKPVYRSLVRDIQNRINGQATLVSPVGRRAVTGLTSRIASSGAKLTRVGTDAGVYVFDDAGKLTIKQPVTNSETFAGGAEYTRTPVGVRSVYNPGAEFTPIANDVPAVISDTPPLPPPPAPLPTPVPAPVGALTPGVGDMPVNGIPVSIDTTPYTGDRCEGINVDTAGRRPQFALTRRDGWGGIGLYDSIDQLWVFSNTVGWFATTRGACAPGASPTIPPLPADGATRPPPLARLDTTPGMITPEEPIPSKQIPIPQPLINVRMDWCGGDVCANAEDALSRLRAQYLPKITETAEEETIFSNWTGYVAGIGIDILSSAVSRFVPGKSVENIYAAAGEALVKQAIHQKTADAFLHDFAPATVGNVQTTGILLARVGTANNISSETGIPLDYLVEGEMQLLRYSAPQYIPSQAEVDSAYIGGTITSKLWECWTRALGNIAQCRVPVLEAGARKPDIAELISLYRRGHIRSKKELNDRLRKLGVLDTQHVDEWLLASQQLPTPSDLIHLSVHDVFDPNKLGRTEMLAELREQKDMLELFEAQGYGTFSIRTPSGREITYNSAELDWLASYKEASPTQTYHMNHRLRPGRTHMFAQFVPGKTPKDLASVIPNSDIRLSPDGKGSIVTPKPITMYEVAKNLKEDDYNPFWRVPLTAISYNVIGRIDLRRLYKTAVFGEPVGTKGFKRNDNGTFTPVGVAERELTERYLDDGYTHIDAAYLAYYTAHEYETGKLSSGRRAAQTRVCSAYKTGVIDYATGVNKLESIGLDNADARRQMEQCDLDHKLQVAKTTTSAIRAKFLSGEWDELRARHELIQAGIVPARRNELIDLWSIQLRRREKEATANDLCRWYNGGIINRKELRTRLINIGYDDGDADRVIRHCELGEMARTAKIRDRQARAIARERTRTMNAQQRTADADKKASEQTFLRFLRFRSEKNLREWLQDGSITAGQVYTTLIAKGASAEDAERWIRHASGTGSRG